MSNLTSNPDRAAIDEVAVAPQGESAPAGQRKPDLLKRQEALVAMGRRAIALPETSILMQDAAALLAEIFDTEVSGIAELSADGLSLRQSLLLTEADTEEPRTSSCETSSEGADSLAGYALQVAHPVVVSNLAVEERFGDAWLRKHGIRSALAVPLKLQDRSFGSLLALSRRDCGFDDDDVLFAETITHLVTTTVARREAEESLAEERRLASGVLQTVDALVIVLDAQWRIVRINAACERVTGFSLDEVRDRRIWDVFAVPEEVETFPRLFREVKASTSPVCYESCLLTKHSQRRRISWSYGTMTGPDGAPQSILATGVDITEQREAEERAERAEKAVEEARQATATSIASGKTHPDFTSEAPPAGEDKAVGVFGRLPIPSNSERRRHPRRAYPYRQKIGAVVDGNLPGPDCFMEVACNDIAAGGFSFLTPKPPESATLVVALGVPPKITHLVAQVRHITRTEEDGKPLFLVGCKCVGRAAY